MRDHDNQKQNGNYYDVSEFGIPWESNPQLRQLAKDYDVDYDDFMECLQSSMTPEEISNELELDIHTAQKLTQAFFENGLVGDLPID